MPGATPDGSGFDERRVTGTGGVGLAVRTTGLDGTAEPVLLVHGLSSNARLWDGVAGLLAQLGHPVAAVDQRGHGRSDKPDDGYDWATLTDDLLAVADDLGWRRPVVAVGQSWGGNVIVELAARHPDRLVAGVLIDGGTIELSTQFADWPTCEAALTPPALSGLPVERLEEMLRLHHPDWPEQGIAGTLGNVEVLPDGAVRPWLSLEHHLTILRGMWDHHPPKRWPEVTVPVLIVPAGDPSGAPARFDTAKRASVAEAEAGLATSATVWIDGDHDLHAQHPATVASLVHAAADGTAFGADR